MKKSVSIKVTGKVQGVFFRQSTLRKASDLGIFGFVRNEDDGSVYIEAEGNEEQMNHFMEWCRRGPASARVDKTEIMEKVYKGFSKFEIVYMR